MQKIKTKAKSNSTITSGKTKIVYTQYYFWQSQNIVLLQRARVPPSFLSLTLTKNSLARSLKMSDCLKKKSLGDFLFSTCRTNASDCLRFALQTKKESLCSLLSLLISNRVIFSIHSRINFFYKDTVSVFAMKCYYWILIK